MIDAEGDTKILARNESLSPVFHFLIVSPLPLLGDPKSREKQGTYFKIKGGNIDGKDFKVLGG